MSGPGRGPKGVMSGVYMWAHQGFGTRASCARIGGSTWSEGIEEPYKAFNQGSMVKCVHHSSCHC